MNNYDTRTDYQRRLEARNAAIKHDYAELTAQQPEVSKNRKCIAIARKYKLSLRQIYYAINGK